MADVTAIVLNWARLDNVKTIVAHLCSDPLRDTISSVIVWNNSSTRLEDSDFGVDGRLKIVNSEENLFFQARFLACLEAEGEWCLVQDDDYLVSVESIKALRKYAALYNVQHPIHLLPPHEHLSTTLRTLTYSPSYTPSFAWLGHGTLLTKSHARAFLDVLRTESGGQEHIMQMADNFFSILLNRSADIWVDRGMHLGGEDVAFTVGAEGDARNWYYIAIAEKYLESIVSRSEPNGFTVLEDKLEEELIVRSPCRGGLWSTNVPVLPPSVLDAARTATDLRSADVSRRSALGEVDAREYIQHSLACIGDDSETVFKSPAGCQEGQWLSFDFLQSVEIAGLQVEWTVEPDFASEVWAMSYQVLEDGQTWVNALVLNCTQVDCPGWVKLVTKLDLGSPRAVNAVRAVIGPGSVSSERPTWGVVECVVGEMTEERSRAFESEPVFFVIYQGAGTGVEKNEKACRWDTQTQSVAEHERVTSRARPPRQRRRHTREQAGMLGHYMPSAMMGGREQGMQGNPMHQQQPPQHMLGQPHHPQQPQPHHPMQQPPHQQQQQFGPQNGQGGPPPNGQDMSLATVLHYLQSEWRRYERERNEWEIERAEMRARIALLEGERRSFDNLKIDWTRRIKMLEYALKVERTKQVNQPATAQSNKVASLRKEDDAAPLKEGSGSSSPRSEDIALPAEARAGAPSGPGQPSSRPQSIAGFNGLTSQSTANLLGTKMTGRDPKSRARSKEYLKQCLQEVNYLTSPQAVNPLPNRPLVSLGPTSTLVSTSAQDMAQQGGQHPQQQQQQSQQHMGQHQPITVALPNLPPFPPMANMNESNQHGSGGDTIGYNGRPRKLVPEVGKDFSGVNGGLEPSLMPESVGAPRDQSSETKGKGAPELISEPTQEQPDVPMSVDEEEPLAPIPLDEPEPTREQDHDEEPPLEQVEPVSEAPQDEPAPTGGATALANMFSSDRNLVTAIFRPDDRGEWKRQLQEAHDEAMRAGTAGSGLENISLKDEFDTDDMDNAAEESEDKTKVWKTRKTLRNHLDAVRAVAFHPSEMCLASGGDDFTVKIWRLDPSSLTSNSRQAQQSIDVEPQLTLRGHTAAVTCLVASPRGLLFSASMDASIRIWAFPPESLQPYAPFDPSYSRGELVGHTDVVWGLALVRDGTWLASGGADGMVKIWEITETGGNLRLSWGYNGADSELEETIPVVAVEGLKHDLRKVAVAYANCIVKVFDIENGKELARLATDETYDGTSATQVNAIASHPTMPLLVTAHEDKFIRIFDVSTGECQHSMLAHLDTVTTLSIDTTGFSLVSGSHDGSIRFWDILGSKTCVQEINAHREKSNEGTLDVAFHPSMPFIASAGADGVVKIYAS